MTDKALGGLKLFLLFTELFKVDVGLLKLFKSCLELADTLLLSTVGLHQGQAALSQAEATPIFTLREAFLRPRRRAERAVLVASADITEVEVH